MTVLAPAPGVVASGSGHSLAAARPAVAIAIALSFGVLLHDWIPIGWLAYGGAGGGLCLAAAAAWHWRILRRALLLGATVCLGIALGQFHRYHFDELSVRHLLPGEESLVRARLEVIQPPGVRGVGTRHLSQQFIGRLLALQRVDGWHAANDTLLVSIAGHLPELRPGILLEAHGEASFIDPPSNPGEYDWREHFARKSIHARLRITNLQQVQITGDRGEGLLWAARRHVREALGTGFEPSSDHLVLLRALLFGDGSESLDELWADFRASGTAHHLSISGTHIAILATLLMLAGRCLILHPRTLLIFVIVFAMLYAAMTQLSPPVVRSVLLCAVIGFSILLGRNVDPVQCLALAAIGMIIYAPLDLLTPGFQLSFGTVAALMIWTKRVVNWIWSFEHEHDRMARLIQPPRGWAAARHYLLLRGSQVFAAALVASWVSMPLVAIHFQQINPWAIPGSILLAAFVTLALAAGLLKVVISLLLPAAGDLLAGPAGLAAAWMRNTVGWLADLPGAELSLARTPAWAILFYIALFSTLLLPARWSRWRASGPAAALLMLMTLPIWLGWLPDRREHLTVTLLSVGNGACTLIQCPSGQNLMVDCGAMDRPELFERTIRPAMRHLNVQHLDAVLITHADRDHVSALPEIETAFTPVVYRRLRREDQLSFGELTIDVLMPPSNTSLRGNDASAVFQLRWAGRSILFTGDIEQKAISAIGTLGDDLRADILIAPHHGAAEKNTATLLSAISPEVIVCSSGRRLSRPQSMFDQIAAPRPVVRTGRGGAITIQISPDGRYTVDSLR